MKRLIFRLSSLGDVILSQAALNLPSAAETHWVVASEYADLLRGNPEIKNVIAFDRRSQSSWDWIRLNRDLARESFDEVLDLHSTLRTRLARLVFWVSCFLSGSTFPRWRRISKSRLSRLGYVTFKSLWPKALMPRPLRSEFLQVASSLPSVASQLALDPKLSGSSVQDLRYLVGSKTQQMGRHPAEIRVGLMPGSAWAGKRWDSKFFVELVTLLKAERSSWIPVIFGDASEPGVREVLESLRTNGLSFEASTGKMPYRDLARAMDSIDFMIANDTGLAHFAEGLGKPVLVLYGPTTPQFGFGPGLLRSRALGSDLWCRPCGKDGSMCFRIGSDRYSCMRSLVPSEVFSAAVKLGDQLTADRGVPLKKSEGGTLV